MPIVNFHLVDGLTSSEQDRQLLVAASKFYAEVLNAPTDRVRAFITAHAPSRFAVVGDLVAVNGLHAPYFEFIVLEGRPCLLTRPLINLSKGSGRAGLIAVPFAAAARQIVWATSVAHTSPPHKIIHSLSQSKRNSLREFSYGSSSQAARLRLSRRLVLAASNQSPRGGRRPVELQCA
jgi:phenylpyruvate tautomerase PptA (4-oxalocrotonate tautomerase family)